MAQKLGFVESNDEVKRLTYDLLDLLEKKKTDYTFFFRNLAKFKIDEIEKFVIDAAFKSWLENYNRLLKKFERIDEIRVEAMNKINPKYILRNYLLQKAIEKAVWENDFSEINKLQKIMEFPYEEQIENEIYAEIPPSWAKEIEISCSS